jgi:hypothetical protein
VSPTTDYLISTILVDIGRTPELSAAWARMSEADRRALVARWRIIFEEEKTIAWPKKPTPVPVPGPGRRIE